MVAIVTKWDGKFIVFNVLLAASTFWGTQTVVIMFVTKVISFILEASVLEMNSTIVALKTLLMNHVVVDEENVFLVFLFLGGDVIET